MSSVTRLSSPYNSRYLGVSIALLLGNCVIRERTWAHRVILAVSIITFQSTGTQKNYFHEMTLATLWLGCIDYLLSLNLSTRHRLLEIKQTNVTNNRRVSASIHFICVSRDIFQRLVHSTPSSAVMMNVMAFDTVSHLSRKNIEDYPIYTHCKIKISSEYHIHKLSDISSSSQSFYLKLRS